MNLSNPILRSVLYLLLVILFLVMGFFIVTYAAGYTIDFKNRQVSKTGLINLIVKTPNVQIYLNDKLVGDKTMILRGLSPDRYKIDVEKDNFHNWTQTIELHEQEAITLTGIVLFRQNPQIELYDSVLNPDSLASLADTESIAVSDGEIYQNDNLVTRLTTEISAASWYPDHKHIVFSSNGKLCIIDTNGTNVIELFKKDSKSFVVFASSGKYVIFEDNGQIYRAQIK